MLKVTLSLPIKNWRLSWMGISHGDIFSSIVPGRNPISFPSGWIGRETITLEYLAEASSRVCSSAAAMAQRVFPEPARPIAVTNMIFGSIKASSKNDCSLFLGLIPQAPLLRAIKGSSGSDLLIYFAIALFLSLELEISITYWLGYRPFSSKNTFPLL